MTPLQKNTMNATQDAARHIDSDAEIVAKHANAGVGFLGNDFFDIVGTVDPNGFEAARQKDYKVEFVKTQSGETCTRFVLEN